VRGARCCAGIKPDVVACRLLDIVHADQKLYLVFEFLDVDLKRYMEAGNAQGTPISLELCQVCVFFSLFTPRPLLAAPARHHLYAMPSPHPLSAVSVWARALSGTPGADRVVTYTPLVSPDTDIRDRLRGSSRLILIIFILPGRAFIT
jgi:hypothetical protein